MRTGRAVTDKCRIALRPARRKLRGQFVSSFLPQCSDVMCGVEQNEETLDEM